MPVQAGHDLEVSKTTTNKAKCEARASETFADNLKTHNILSIPLPKVPTTAAFEIHLPNLQRHKTRYPV